MAKIIIMSGEEKAELERQARSRHAFRSMLTSGEYRPNVFRNRKRHEKSSRGLREVREARRGQWQEYVAEKHGR